MQVWRAAPFSDADHLGILALTPLSLLGEQPLDLVYVPISIEGMLPPLSSLTIPEEVVSTGLNIC